jgi:hypothetical protein
MNVETKRLPLEPHPCRCATRTLGDEVCALDVRFGQIETWQAVPAQVRFCADSRHLPPAAVRPGKRLNPDWRYSTTARHEETASPCHRLFAMFWPAMSQPASFLAIRSNTPARPAAILDARPAQFDPEHDLFDLNLPGRKQEVLTDHSGDANAPTLAGSECRRTRSIRQLPRQTRKLHFACGA